MTVSGNSAPRSSAESVGLAAQVGRVAAPLRQQVLDVLRQAILSFHYAPGQRLIERELIEEIGVSRTTIREALRELAAEGLVKTIPQKGAVVVVPSPQEALELYELRAVLEALAVRRFTEVASDEQVAELRAAFEQLAEAASGEGETLRILKAKDHFYDVLLRGCGNRSVHSTLSGVQAGSACCEPRRWHSPGAPGAVCRSCARWSRPSRRAMPRPPCVPATTTSSRRSGLDSRGCPPPVGCRSAAPRSEYARRHIRISGSVHDVPAVR